MVRARIKNIDFELRTEGLLPAFVRSDEKRLRQIIINLLSNALRYTEEGAVTFKLTYRNEVAIIEVSDSGIGIAPEFIDRIWRPFERGERRDIQGSGLGLTITKLLVEILGGEIEVESTLGKGSVFRVRLMLPSVTPSVFDPRIMDLESKALPVNGYDGPRKTILVVDDDFNHLALAENFLTKYGFVVLCASSVDMAETMLADAAPDIILLDIDMPGRDGWSFARDLRTGRHQNTPIVMISGHANEEGLHRAALGLHDAFFAKPYNLDELLLQIAELLKVKLIMGKNRSVPVLRSLTEHERKRLLDAAEIGHASALRAELDDLRVAGVGPVSLMRAFEACLEQFDMEGLARLLEDHHEDA